MTKRTDTIIQGSGTPDPGILPAGGGERNCLARLCGHRSVHANSASARAYEELIRFRIGVHLGARATEFTLLELVNDGLMALFFFVVGMEIKRELVHGELRTRARALLPGVAALGGMIVPSLIYLAFNWGRPGQHGWGIPMVTDIAFCIGCLTLLRSRVPTR